MPQINKSLYWTPRILSIIFIVFLGLFSADVIGMQAGFWPTILGLLMHNIPSLVLLAVLLIAWKHEIVGAIFFVLAGLVYIIMLLANPAFPRDNIVWSLIIAGPVWLIGILFYLNWVKKRKPTTQSQ